MNKLILLTLIWTTSILADNKKDGYLVQVYGPVVKSYYGDCVHTYYYDRSTEEREDCGGKPKKPKVEPALIKRTVIEKVTLSDVNEVLFNFDTAILTLPGNQLLNNLANKIGKYDIVNLAIDGYTDMLGSKEYNLKLSKERAESVKEFFVAHGFNKDKISTNGLGESEAVVSKACLAKYNQQNPSVRLDLIKCMAADRKVIITIKHNQNVEKIIMESSISDKSDASAPK